MDITTVRIIINSSEYLSLINLEIIANIGIPSDLGHLGVGPRQLVVIAMNSLKLGIQNGLITRFSESKTSIYEFTRNWIPSMARASRHYIHGFIWHPASPRLRRTSITHQASTLASSRQAGAINGNFSYAFRRTAILRMELREPLVAYNALFKAENADIEAKTRAF